MALRVLTASSTAALIALATVKDRLGITDTAQDTQLNQLIAEASSAIVAYLGRDLARQRYEQSTRGDHRRRLLLERFPVDRDSITLTVDGTAATDFSIFNADVGMLSRAVGWPCPSSADDDENNVVVTYKAGYVLPDQLSNYPADSYASGYFIRPPASSGSPYLFEITTLGDIEGSAPDWSIAPGETTQVPGFAILTCRDAQELPPVLMNCAWLTVQEFRQRLTRLAGATSMSADGFSASYDLKALDCALPGNVERSLDQWRIQA